VREHALDDRVILHSFLPKGAIETVVECAVDLEERVEVGETKLAFAFMRRAIMRRISSGSFGGGIVTGPRWRYEIVGRRKRGVWKRG
jgi:hypothetical protein